jgi:hypothetical protein
MQTRSASSEQAPKVVYLQKTKKRNVRKEQTLRFLILCARIPSQTLTAGRTPNLAELKKTLAEVL